MEILEFISEKVKECKNETDYKSIIAFLLEEYIELQNNYTETINIIKEMYGEADASLILDIIHSKNTTIDNQFPIGNNGEELAIISKTLALKMMENELDVYEVFPSPDIPSVLLKTKDELENANVVAIDSKLAALTGELLYKSMIGDKIIDTPDTKEK